MKTISKFSLVLIVCSLIMLSWHTTASANTQTKSASKSESSSFPVPDPPGRVVAGDDIFTINVSTSYLGTITIAGTTHNFTGLSTTINFDDLSLQPGNYSVTESLSATLSGSSPFVPFNPVNLSVDYDTWSTYLAPGDIITISVSVSVTSASVGGDFSGPLGLRLPGPPPSSLRVRAIVTKEKGETISYSASFTADVTKTTTVTSVLSPLAFTAPTSEPTYATDVNECEPLSFTVAAADDQGNPAETITTNLAAEPFATLGATFDGSTFSWTPSPDTVNADAPFSFTLTATRGEQPPATLEVTITVNNVPPPVFTDPTSDPTYADSVDECNPLSFTVAAEDSAGSPVDVTADLSDAGALGATFDGASFAWTPLADAVPETGGTFTVTFTATDECEQTTTLVATITVNDVPPPVFTLPAAGPTYDAGAVAEEAATPLSFTVAAEDSAGNPVPVTADLSDAGALGATFSGGVFSWTPPANAADTPPGSQDYTVTFTATLTIGECVLTTPLTVTITVTDVLQPPELSLSPPDTSYNVSEGGTVEFVVTATDPDGDDEAVVISDSGVPTTLGASFTTGSAGTFSWQIPYNAVTAGESPKDFIITFNATDEDGTPAETPLTVTINVTDVPLDPPEFTAPTTGAPYDAGAFNEGDTVTFDVTAINPNLPIGPDEVAIEASGDPMGLGAGFSGGVFSWMIPPNAVEPPPDEQIFTVTFTATLEINGEVLTETLTATITVNDVSELPPQFVEVGAQGVKEGETVSFDVVVNHDRAFALTHSALPPGASFNPATGAFEWITNENTVTPNPADLPATLTLAPTVTFTATDDTAVPPLVSTMDVTITVEDVTPITLTVTGNRSGLENQPITLQLTATDPLGQTPTFSMNSIPGSALSATTGSFQWTPEYSTVNPGFAPGTPPSDTFPVIFSAEVERGMTDDEPVTITVTDDNPEPAITPVGDVDIDEQETRQIAITATDEEGEPLTLSGTLPPWASLTDNGDGTGTLTLMPGLDVVGITEGLEKDFSITSTVTDARGKSDSVTFTITVRNKISAPELAPIDNQEIEEGQTVTVPLTVTDEDTDPSDLIYSASIGTVTDSTWAYTPPLDTVPETLMPIVVTITVADPEGNTDSESFDLTVTDFNPAPVMEAVGSQSVSEGDTLTVSLRASDAEGEHFAFGYLVSPSFPTGSGVTESFDPETGILTVAPDFDTNVHPELSQDFTVTAWATDDRTAESNRVTFTITIDDTNRLPKLASIGNKSVTFNTGTGAYDELTFTVTATDLDVEDNTNLTYEIRFGPSDATFNDATGVFSWTPTEEPDTNPVPGVTFFARDGVGGVDYEIINIAVGEVNLPPEITGINGETALRFPVSEGDTAFTLTVTATDDTLAPDALTYSASGVPGGDEENQDGTTSATGATFDPVTHTFTWPFVGYNRAATSTAAGLYALTLAVSDGTLSDSVVVVIVVSPTNREPAIALGIPDTVNEGGELIGGVLATDHDGDELTLRVDGKPEGAEIEGASGTWGLTWTPNYSVVSPPDPHRDFPMTFRVGDGIAEVTASDTVRVMDVNLPPVIRTVGGTPPDAGGNVTLNTAEMATLTFAVVASDPEGGLLDFSASGVPESLGASFDNGAGTFSWPNIPFGAGGTHVVTVTATDNANDSTSATAIINVAETNQPPEIASIDGTRTVEENEILTLTIVTNDPDGDPVVLSESGLPAGAQLTGDGIVWQTGYDDAGDYPVTITATDQPGGATDVEDVTISVTNFNRKPTLSDIEREVNLGDTVSFTLSDFVDDPDGDNITTYSSPDKPADATLDPATGAFSWIPDAPGDHTITFRATDDGEPAPETSDDAVATIHVIDVETDRPVVSGLSVSGNKGPISISFTVTDRDSASGDVSATVEYKGEGEVAFSSIGSTSGTGSQSLSWNSGAANAGKGTNPTQYVVRVTGNDGEDGNPVTSGSFLVDNEAPQLIGAAPGALIGTTGDPVTISVTAEDNVGITSAAVTVTPIGGVSNNYTMTAAGNTYTYPYVVPENYIGFISYQIGLVDAVGNPTTTSTALISVTDNDPPVADAGPDKTVDQGDPVVFDGTGSTDNIPGFLTYRWDVDASDGVDFNTGPSGATITHAYDQPGIYTVSLEVTDLANLKGTNTMAVTVTDTEPPNPPVIAEILPFPITKSGDITVKGTAEVNATVSVKLKVGDVVAKEGSATAANGAFSVSFSSVAEGTYSITAIATDIADNPSDESSGALTVDLTPPLVEITSPQANAVTSPTPPLSASFDAGIAGLGMAQMKLFEGGTEVPLDVTTDFSPDGTGTINGTPTRNLVRIVSYELEVMVGDLAVNSTTASFGFTYDPFATDQTPPGISGISPQGAINRKRPKIAATFTDDGSGVNAESISIGLTGGTPALGAIQYNSKTGAAFALPDGDLEDGTYTATFSVEDNNGISASDSVDFTVDATGPDAPTPGAIPDFTPTSPITMTGGIAEPGSEVKVTINGNHRGTATADATTGDFTMDLPLTEGKNNVVFTATDTLDNVGSPSTAVTTILDTEDPVISDKFPTGEISKATPTITALITDSTALTQDVSGISTVSMTFGSASGTFDPGTGVVSYAIPVGTLVDGTIYTVDVSCEDNAGHTTSDSWTFTYRDVVTDVTPPTISISSPTDGAVFNQSTGNTATISASISDAGTGVVSALMFRNDTIETLDEFNSGTGQETVGLSGTVDFPDGGYTVTVFAIDGAGKSNTQTVSFTVDTTIEPPVLNDFAQEFTANTTEDIIGTAENGAMVEIFRNGVSVGTAHASTFTKAVALLEGTNTFTAIATDVAGNVSAESASASILRDTENPSISNFSPVGVTSNQTPTISMTISDGLGSGVPGINLMMLLPGGPVSGYSYDEASGSLTYTSSSALSEGEYTVIVTCSDRTSRSTNAQFSFTVDVTGPSISGFSPGDGAEIGNNPAFFPKTISATVTDSSGVSSVEMLLDGSSVGVYNGRSIQHSVSSLTDDFHTVQVQAMDIAGNSNVANVTFIVGDVTDKTPPAIAFSYPPDGSEISGTSYYVVELVLVDGDSGPHWETMTVLFNGIDETETIDGGGGGRLDRDSGTLTIYPRKLTKSGPLDLSQLERPTGFAKGQNSIQIRMADQAGNVMNKTLTFSIPEPPNAPILAEIPSPTNQTTVAVTGNVLAAASSVQVTVSVNDLTAGTVPVDDAGNFTLEEAILVAGTNTITARASDSAGNVSGTSMPVKVLLDQTPPDVKLLDVMLTELPEATKTETLYARAQFVDNSGLPPTSFKLVLNEVEQVLADQMDVTLMLTLTQGPNTIVLHATDAAGNEAVSPTYEIELDTVGPETAPENLRAGVDVSGADIVLTWETDVNAATYNVYKNIQTITNTIISFLAPVATNVSGTSWTDIDVMPSLTYYYAVTSVDVAGNKGTQISNSPNVTLIPATMGGMIVVDSTRLTFTPASLSANPLLVGAVTIEALADDGVPSLEGSVAGSVISLTATSQSGGAITEAFNSPAQFSTPYSGAIESPENLRIFLLADNAWTQVGNATVIPGNLASANIPSFGTYQLATVTPIPWDVNSDGKVDISDLVIVASHFGEEGPEIIGDVNGDEIVDISDFVLVGKHFGETYGSSPSSAPEFSSLSPKADIILSVTDNGQYITVTVSTKTAEALSGFQFDVEFDSTALQLVTVEEGELLKAYGSGTFWLPPEIKSGRVTNVASTALNINKFSTKVKANEGEQKLASIVFKAPEDAAQARLHAYEALASIHVQNMKLTDVDARAIPFVIDQTVNFKSTTYAHTNALLQNYPNPFNPETWIPYQLAQTSQVTITIYSALGQTVRTLNLGQKDAGMYLSKQTSAYWDGRNATGELVSSGVYFYRIQTGAFSATKKLVVLK